MKSLMTHNQPFNRVPIIGMFRLDPLSAEIAKRHGIEVLLGVV
jgi:hypothetical protein